MVPPLKEGGDGIDSADTARARLTEAEYWLREAFGHAIFLDAPVVTHSPPEALVRGALGSPDEPSQAHPLTIT